MPPGLVKHRTLPVSSHPDFAPRCFRETAWMEVARVSVIHKCSQVNASQRYFVAPDEGC